MKEEFREKVVTTADKAMGWINDYFEGKSADENKINKAIKMVQFGVKMVHMDQIKEQGNKSLALRLIRFLPENVKQDYIKMTNPEVTPLLLGSQPSGSKK